MSLDKLNPGYERSIIKQLLVDLSNKLSDIFQLGKAIMTTIESERAREQEKLWRKG